MSRRAHYWEPPAHADEDVLDAAQEHGVVVTTTFTAVPEQPMTVDRVLRQLELVRRCLAIRWTHSVEVMAATQAEAPGSRLVLAGGEGRTLQVDTSPRRSSATAALQKKDVS